MISNHNLDTIDYEVLEALFRDMSTEWYTNYTFDIIE